jgi:hypothetical protein
MLPLIVWLASLTAAAASQGASGYEADLRLKALKARIGMDLHGRRNPRAMTHGGVTIRAWGDGSRIVRFVTHHQLLAALRTFPPERLRVDEDDMVCSVEVDEDSPDGGPLCSEDEERAVYALLDPANRVLAVVVCRFSDYNEAFVPEEIMGPAEGPIRGTSRSKIYQFLRDYGLNIGVDDHSDGDLGWSLFYDDIPIHGALLRAIDQIDSGADCDTKSVMDELSKIGGSYSGYYLAYAELVHDLWLYEGRLADLDIIQNARDDDFIEYLEDSGHDMLQEKHGVDIETVRRALLEGDEDAKGELDDAGFELDTFRRQMAGDLIWLELQDMVQELLRSIENERDAFNDLLDFHDLEAMPSWRGGRGPNDVQKYEIKTRSAPWADGMPEQEVVEVYVEFSSDEPPSWVVGGHSYGPPNQSPGFLQAMRAGGWIETWRELYEADKDELVFDWPGEDMEFEELLDINTNPVQMHLMEFLRISMRHHLLHPDVLDYWSKMLAEES